MVISQKKMIRHKRIQELLFLGKNLTEIATEIGVSRKTLYKDLAEIGDILSVDKKEVIVNEFVSQYITGLNQLYKYSLSTLNKARKNKDVKEETLAIQKVMDLLNQKKRFMQELNLLERKLGDIDVDVDIRKIDVKFVSKYGKQTLENY